VHCGGVVVQKHAKLLHHNLVPTKQIHLPAQTIILQSSAGLGDLAKNLRIVSLVDAFPAMSSDSSYFLHPLEATFALLAMQLHKGVPSRKLKTGRIGLLLVLLLYPPIHKFRAEGQTAICIPDDVG
jgi:hypothetical protein